MSLRTGVTTALIFLFFCVAAGQSVYVSSSLDTNRIITGEQLIYSMTIESPQGTYVELPLLSDTLSAKVEVLSPLAFDTLLLDDGNVRYKHQYLITAFDSGDHVIHPKPYVISLDKQRFDTLYDTPITLTVDLFPADSADVIRDLLPPIHPRITFREIWTYLVMVLLVLLLILALWYYFRYYRKGKMPEFMEKPKVPPHVTALQQLAELKQKKWWQNNELKLYWSALSAILRRYFEDRFHFPAMESVTDEIMEALPGYMENRELTDKVQMLLHTADMVKFAKETPQADVNTRAMDTAFEVVRTTMEAEDAEGKATELDDMKGENSQL